MTKNEEIEVNRQAVVYAAQELSKAEQENERLKKLLKIERTQHTVTLEWKEFYKEQLMKKTESFAELKKLEEEKKKDDLSRARSLALPTEDDLSFLISRLGRKQ